MRQILYCLVLVNVFLLLFVCNKKNESAIIVSEYKNASEKPNEIFKKRVNNIISRILIRLHITTGLCAGVALEFRPPEQMPGFLIKINV